MAEAVVSFLLEKLSTLLTEKRNQLKGLGKDVEFIKHELESMRCFLIKAEAKQDSGHLDEEQKIWIKEVREVAYEMEDVVDNFLLRFPNHGSAGFRAHARHTYESVKNVRACHHISSEIIRIKERVKDIAERHKRYQPTEGGSSYSSSSSRQRASHLQKEDDLVAIDEPKCELISLILNNISHLQAISVVGMVGLGKTTLVRRVYEARDVKKAFSIHAWLDISQTFKIEDAFKDLITQICHDKKKHIPHGLDCMDANGLGAFVKDFLKDKRYIIVLNDLWSLDHWDSIKYVFPNNDNRCSRILITTQKEDVANMCRKDTNGNVYRIKPLSNDDSWKLFCRKTFGEESCPPHLKDIAWNIMSKCEGLPLGIVAIGRLLASKDTTKPGDWDMVLRSLSNELQGNGKLSSSITNIFLLGYNDLSYPLKSCLLYMGIIPENRSIKIEELAFLWIAEGFVKVIPEMTTMEVALNYLKELEDRSLVQVEKTELDERLWSCHVHNLVYKIILTKCREHDILTPTPSTPYTEKVRRLVVTLDSTTKRAFPVVACPKEPFPLLHLRSLIINESLSESDSYKFLIGIPKLLKVLNLSGVRDLSTIPKEVFKLYNLTYLYLGNTKVKKIPKTIGDLENLEYLNLEDTLVEKLPKDIRKLKKLFYLRVHGECTYNGKSAGFKAPKELGGLSSLQYLSIVKADTEEVIREIGKLTQLRVLEITGITRANGWQLYSSLQNLRNLQILCIKTSTDNEIIDLEYPFSTALQFLNALTLRGPFVNILDWIPSFQGLSILCLDKSCLKDYQLESFAGLPNLVQLKLVYDSYEGNTLHFKSGGFPKLKRLELHGLTALESVIFEKGTLSDLETLEIDQCVNMKTERPIVGLQYLRNLRSLQLYGISAWVLQNISHYYKIGISEILVGDRKSERLRW